MLIADDVALDFVNSIAAPTGTQIEWLANGEDLIAWLQRVGLVTPEAVEQIRRTAFPGELDDVSAQARSLREWFRAFVVKYKGAELKRASLTELARLNAILERDSSYKAITQPERRKKGGAANESRFELRDKRRWTGPSSLLIPIAEAMADLVCTADFARVKRCEGPACTLLFLDKTHAAGRRWCSMAICGNRAKQASHRKRAKQE
jgi:predicted RNA-binding Zn ribbon-like protein